MDNLSIRDLLLLTCMGSFIACAPGAETIPPLQFGNFFRTQWNGIAINHFGRIGPLGQLINARRDATDGVSCRHSSRFPLLRLDDPPDLWEKLLSPGHPWSGLFRPRCGEVVCAAPTHTHRAKGLQTPPWRPHGGVHAFVVPRLARSR
jgi:hypothetical protein